MYKLVFKLIVINVIVVFSSDEYHQVIMTVFVVSASEVSVYRVTMLTNERMVLQDLCGPLLHSKSMCAAMLSSEDWMNSCKPKGKNKEEEHTSDGVIRPFGSTRSGFI